MLQNIWVCHQPWAKKSLCSLDWTNNTEFLESAEATSYRHKVDIWRWATKSAGRMKGGVKFCRTERMQYARHYCTSRAVFYNGGCFYCIMDENTGMREHCDGLIDFECICHKYWIKKSDWFLPKCFMSSSYLHHFIKSRGNKEILKCTVILK